MFPRRLREVDFEDKVWSFSVIFWGLHFGKTRWVVGCFAPKICAQACVGKAVLMCGGPLVLMSFDVFCLMSSCSGWINVNFPPVAHKTGESCAQGKRGFAQVMHRLCTGGGGFFGFFSKQCLVNTPPAVCLVDSLPNSIQDTGRGLEAGRGSWRPGWCWGSGPGEKEAYVAPGGGNSWRERNGWSG